MTTTKIDDNILYLFQHRPQVILRNVPMTRKMNPTPDNAKQNDKSVLFRKDFFTNVTCKIARYGNSSGQINVCVKLITRQHALASWPIAHFLQ